MCAAKPGVCSQARCLKASPGAHTLAEESQLSFSDLHTYSVAYKNNRKKKTTNRHQPGLTNVFNLFTPDIGFYIEHTQRWLQVCFTWTEKASFVSEALCVALPG